MAITLEEIAQILLLYNPSKDDVTDALSAVDHLNSVESPEQAQQILLNMFERCPDEDSDIVFWSALHTLETLPGYEKSLVISIERKPSCFGLLMINRILNVGQHYVGATSLLGLLESVRYDLGASESVRLDASDFLKYQEKKDC